MSHRARPGVFLTWFLHNDDYFRVCLVFSHMLIRVNVVQVCDARDDDSSNAADNIKIKI